MFFSRILSFAAIAATALVACAKPISPVVNAVSVERRSADPLLDLATTFNTDVTAAVAGLDGVVNPAEAIAEVLAAIDAYVSAIVTIKVNATQIAVDVEAIVNEVSEAYTAITAALQKYEAVLDADIKAIIAQAETDIANAISTLITDTQTFIKDFVTKLQSAVHQLAKFLNITLTLKIKLTILGLTIYL